MTSRWWRSVALVAAAVGTAAVPFVVDAARSGPAADMRGGAPGSEKIRLIERAQREHEAALARTPAPAVGPPEERWRPVIVEGIVESADSPFEGSSFMLSNLWQGRLSADGRVTRVYAGVDGDRALLIVLRQVLETGDRELYREIELPPGVGVPRLTGAAGGELTVKTSLGHRFRFDVARLTLR